MELLLGITLVSCLAILVALGFRAHHKNSKSSISLAIDLPDTGRYLSHNSTASPSISPDISDEDFEGTIHRAYGKQIEKAFYIKIAGTSHRNTDGSSRREAINSCRPLDVLQVIPEPDNPYDSNALAVFNPSGVQIGYLESRLAGEIARASAKRNLMWLAVFRRATHHPETGRAVGAIVYIVRLLPDRPLG